MLTIMITCFNQSDIVIKNVDNILKNNKHLDIEILISDDYSTDNSFERLIEKYKHECCVKIIRPEINMGVSNNRNTLLKNVSKKYCLFIDGDDIQDDKYISTIYDKLDNDDIYYIKTFTEIWGKNKRIVKDSYMYDNVFLYVFKTECIKDKHFDIDLEIGEDLEFCARYYDYIESGNVTIDVSYLLNRQEDNISLTKNGDLELRYSRDEILLNRLVKYEENCDNKMSGKINQKKIDLINQAVLLNKKIHIDNVNSKYVSRKHKLSYIAYKFFKAIHLIVVYKFFVNKFIGHKI